MKTNTYILYEKIKELDLNIFKNSFPNKVQINPNIKRKMMFIGTEFERAFTSILSQKYGLLTDELRIIISKKVTDNNIIIGYREKNEIKKSITFNLIESINKFDYFFNKSKGCNVNNNDEELDEIYIKELLKNINFDKFKPKEIILTKVKFITKFDSFIGGVNGEIDLIIDDKIIDIKTDTVLKLNKDYIVQLLFYFFLLNYSQSAFENTEWLLNKLKINTLCLYYASFDLMIEFDVNKIFSNNINILSEIDYLVHNEFINYNFSLREIIRFVVFKNEINENYFEDIKNKSIENQLKSYKFHIDTRFMFNSEINKNINFKTDFLLQLIKINLSLLELKETDSISKENYDLILKHLIVSFRISYKNAPTRNLLRSNDKHLYMCLKDYYEINNARNSNNYNTRYIEIEDKNIEEFEQFLQTRKLLYLELYNQKINNNITTKEFELIRDFILILLEYDIMYNKKSNNESNVVILRIIKSYKKDVAESIFTKKHLENIIHKLLSN